MRQWLPSEDIKITVRTVLFHAQYASYLQIAKLLLAQEQFLTRHTSCTCFHGKDAVWTLCFLQAYCCSLHWYVSLLGSSHAAEVKAVSGHELGRQSVGSEARLALLGT